MNLLTIEDLRILDAIDRRGSFAKASEELNKATSALSYGVQRLEDRLGITVFERQGRRSVLTSAGRLLLVEGRKILGAVDLLSAQAKEMATGWEPRLRIGLESTADHDPFFQVLSSFLLKHESMEIDVSQSVLSGGWEALEHDRIDLLVGAPGPAPKQKGFRSEVIRRADLVAVIASHHPKAKQCSELESFQQVLPQLRRVVMHDTSTLEVARDAGLSVGNQHIYVQTMDQKLAAQLAGLGIGHLPRKLVEPYLDSGRLMVLPFANRSPVTYIAWRKSHGGKALKALTERLIEVYQAEGLPSE